LFFEWKHFRKIGADTGRKGDRSLKKMGLFLFSLFILSTGSLFAQEGKIQGIVQMDDSTPLQGATVSIPGTDVKTVTDEKGFYEVSQIMQGKYVLQASMEGFQKQEKTVYIQEGKTIIVNFILEIKKLSEEAKVTAERPLLTTTEKVSQISLTPYQIETLPSLGEKDIFRAFQLLPGISGSNETSSGLYVRGGTPDQNLILYDGATIFHVDHLYGYFSAFNMEAIDEVRLSKGGFESKYGGRLSSVMELEGKQGEDTLAAGLGLSLLSFNGLAGIPLFNHKGSFFIAGRRSFQSPLYNKIQDMFTSNTETFGGFGGGPGGGGGAWAGENLFESQPSSYFYDVNSKLSFNPNPDNSLSISFYNGMDDLDNSRSMELPSFIMEDYEDMEEGGIETTDVSQWGNTGVSACWTNKWRPSFLSHVAFTFSNYMSRRERSSEGSFGEDWTPANDGEMEEIDIEPPSQHPSFTDRGLNEDNDVQNLTFRWNNTYFLGEKNRLEFGTEISSNKTQYVYDTNNPLEEDENNRDNFLNILDRDDQGIQYSVYLQDKWTPFNSLSITPGLRAFYFNKTEKTYFAPRLSFNCRLTDNISLKGAWGKYFQTVNRITREDIREGDREFWMLSDGEHIPVSQATHSIAGISYETGPFLFNVEAFFKDIKGLTEFTLRFSPTEQIDFTDYFYEGTGTAKGIEFLAQKRFGAYSGWISYTLSKAEYTFSELETEPFPASHDQTHEFKIVNSYEFSDITLSGTWIYSTGKPYTEPVGIEEVIFTEHNDSDFSLYELIYGDKNGVRLPPFHRLDLSAAYDFKWGTTQSTLGVTVFNVYDRKNIWYKEFEIIDGELIENDILFMGLTFNAFFNIKF